MANSNNKVKENGISSVSEKSNKFLSPFKLMQLKYRRQGNVTFQNPEDFKDILNFSDEQCIWNDDRIIRIESPSSTYKGQMYGLKDFPGFLFIPNALSKDLQNQLAYSCVTEFTNGNKNLYRTNIDNLENDETKTSMWTRWKQEQKEGKCKRYDLQQKHINSSKGTREYNINNQRKKKVRRLDKLSWVTIGYHYNWTERSYTESDKSPNNTIPQYIDCIGKIFASTSLLVERNSSISKSNNNDDNNDDSNNHGQRQQHPRINPRSSSCYQNHRGQDNYYDHDQNQSTKRHKHNNSHDGIENNSFSSEAIIINYYNKKSIMGGHKDDLELTFDKPVISISIGLPAIFLLGGDGVGKDKEEGDDDDDKNESICIPILIQSGDILVLGGQSRLCYHGVARVLSNDIVIPSSSCSFEGDDDHCHHNDGDVNSKNKLTTRTLLKLQEQSNKNSTFNDNSTVCRVDDDDCNDEKKFMNNEAKKLMLETSIDSNINNNHNHYYDNDDDEIMLNEYLLNHRININIRQVLPDDMECIPSS